MAKKTKVKAKSKSKAAPKKKKSGTKKPTVKKPKVVDEKYLCNECGMEFDAAENEQFHLNIVEESECPGQILKAVLNTDPTVDTQPTDPPEPTPALQEPVTRRILLKMSCTRAGSCCGGSGSGKGRNRYAIVDVRKDEEGEGWSLVNCTPSSSNLLGLAKKYPPMWRGSVFGMKLHEDAKFLKDLAAQGCEIKDGCSVVV